MSLPNLKQWDSQLSFDSTEWSSLFLSSVSHSLRFNSSPISHNEVKLKTLSHVQLFVTPWTVAYQAPPSMGFSRQEYYHWVLIYLSGNGEWRCLTLGFVGGGMKDYRRHFWNLAGTQKVWILLQFFFWLIFFSCSHLNLKKPLIQAKSKG